MQDQENQRVQLQEWTQALEDVIEHEGKVFASSLLQRFLKNAQKNLDIQEVYLSSYANTYCDAPDMPLSFESSECIEKYVLWNASAMVVRAGKRNASLGGHLSTFASASTLYRVGWDYFFRAHQPDKPGDIIYFQGHASPGMYAQAFVEGWLSEKHLDRFRQETAAGKGLSSYPHPLLMPDFWEFATVSMGLGPLQAIWSAKWLKTMHDRNMRSLDGRKVWAFCGDGEMDEPESRGCLHIASQYQLNHLIFVVNCNLQRLDGPVRGNAKIMQELERTFLGAGWRVIKVVWNRAWDDVFALDETGSIQSYLDALIDGTYQALATQGMAAFVAHVVQHVPQAKHVFEQLSAEHIARLGPGGHDHSKVYTAYYHAVHDHGDKPRVILAHTQKGHGLGGRIAGANATHQHKKLMEQDLLHYAKYLGISLPMQGITEAMYARPSEEDKHLKWLHAQRKSLGGYVPRRWQTPVEVALPAANCLHALKQAGDRSMSTTMAYVRLLQLWLKEPVFREVLLPIVADESRTFGMEGLFRQVGIYHPGGQSYTPVDSQQLMPYTEKSDGILLQEGLNEAGALASWLAAATSYSHSQKAVLPLYIYYSMFGFQRVGDLIWAAGDMRARGFLLGATSGRTTLPGEGLQHCDGQSMMSASMHAHCVSYDVCYAYELAVIMQRGVERMLGEGEDVFYYLALTNEAYDMPKMPEGKDCDMEQMIVEGMYPLDGQVHTPSVDVHLLGGGTLLREAIKASEVLKALGVHAKVWGVTSFTELARQARQSVSTLSTHRTDALQKCLADGCPVIAVSDHVVAYPEQIRAYITNVMVTLGTDGYGLSDTREALRQYFKVDEASITLHAMQLVSDRQKKWLQAYQRLDTEYQKRYAMYEGTQDREESRHVD